MIHVSPLCQAAGLFPPPPGPDDDPTFWDLAVNAHQPCDGYATNHAWCDCPCHLGDLEGALT